MQEPMASLVVMNFLLRRSVSTDVVAAGRPDGSRRPPLVHIFGTVNDFACRGASAEIMV